MLSFPIAIGVSGGRGGKGHPVRNCKFNIPVVVSVFVDVDAPFRYHPTARKFVPPFIGFFQWVAYQHGITPPSVHWR